MGPNVGLKNTTGYKRSGALKALKRLLPYEKKLYYENIAFFIGNLAINIKISAYHTLFKKYLSRKN